MKYFRSIALLSTLLSTHCLTKNEKGGHEFYDEVLNIYQLPNNYFLNSFNFKFTKEGNGF